MDFYKSKDCFTDVRCADEQRNSKYIWREELSRKHWVSVRDAIIREINHLWLTDMSYVSFWEEDWFPGYEEFLEDLQQLGYHIYCGSSERRGNVGSTQRRFCIYLDALAGNVEWSKDA